MNEWVGVRSSRFASQGLGLVRHRCVAVGAGVSSCRNREFPVPDGVLFCGIVVLSGAVGCVGTGREDSNFLHDPPAAETNLGPRIQRAGRSVGPRPRVHFDRVSVHRANEPGGDVVPESQPRV